MVQLVDGQINGSRSWRPTHRVLDLLYQRITTENYYVVSTEYITPQMTLKAVSVGDRYYSTTIQL